MNKTEFYLLHIHEYWASPLRSVFDQAGIMICDLIMNILDSLSATYSWTDRFLCFSKPDCVFTNLCRINNLALPATYVLIYRNAYLRSLMSRQKSVSATYLCHFWQTGFQMCDQFMNRLNFRCRFCSNKPESLSATYYWMYLTAYLQMIYEQTEFLICDLFINKSESLYAIYNGRNKILSWNCIRRHEQFAVIDMCISIGSMLACSFLGKEFLCMCMCLDCGRHTWITWSVLIHNAMPSNAYLWRTDIIFGFQQTWTILFSGVSSALCWHHHDDAETIKHAVMFGNKFCLMHDCLRCVMMYKHARYAYDE